MDINQFVDDINQWATQEGISVFRGELKGMQMTAQWADDEADAFLEIAARFEVKMIMLQIKKLDSGRVYDNLTHDYQEILDEWGTTDELDKVFHTLEEKDDEILTVEISFTIEDVLYKFSRQNSETWDVIYKAAEILELEYKPKMDEQNKRKNYGKLEKDEIDDLGIQLAKMEGYIFARNLTKKGEDMLGALLKSLGLNRVDIGLSQYWIISKANSYFDEHLKEQAEEWAIQKIVPLIKAGKPRTEMRALLSVGETTLNKYYFKAKAIAESS